MLSSVGGTGWAAPWACGAVRMEIGDDTWYASSKLMAGRGMATA